MLKFPLVDEAHSALKHAVLLQQALQELYNKSFRGGFREIANKWPQDKSLTWEGPLQHEDV